MRYRYNVISISCFQILRERMDGHERFCYYSGYVCLCTAVVLVCTLLFHARQGRRVMAVACTRYIMEFHYFTAYRQFVGMHLFRPLTTVDVNTLLDNIWPILFAAWAHARGLFLRAFFRCIQGEERQAFLFYWRVRDMDGQGSRDPRSPSPSNPQHPSTARCYPPEISDICILPMTHKQPPCYSVRDTIYETLLTYRQVSGNMSLLSP